MSDEKLVNDKKWIIILLCILILAFVIRFIPYSQEGFSDYDPYVHYSVVEQALGKGELPLHNFLDGCPERIEATHPIGFYFFPWLLGHFISLKFAFALTSVLFGVLSIFLIYILLRMILGNRAALIGVLFLAVSFGHVWKSNALIYRGDNFVLAPLLLSLIFGLMFLKGENKLLCSILAGAASALSVLFWPGYPYALFVYSFSLALFIVYDFFSGRDVKVNSNYSIISLAVLALMSFIFLFFVQSNVFVSVSSLYLVLACVLVFIILIRISSEYISSTRGKVILMCIFGAVLAVLCFIMKDYIIDILRGFGFIKPSIAFYKNIAELSPISSKAIFEALWIIPIFSLMGLVVFFKKMDNKKIFLLVPIITGIYLLTTTIRFLFLGSFFVVPLIGVLFDLLISWKRKIGCILLGILFLLTAVNAVYATKSISGYADSDTIEALKYFGENTPQGACLASIPDWGGFVQYYAERASYTSSTNQNLRRFNKFSGFFYTNSSFDLSDDKNFYVGLVPGDFLKMRGFIRVNGFEGLNMEKITLVETNQTSNFNESVYIAKGGNAYFIYFYNNGSIAAELSSSSMPKSLIRTVYIESGDKVFKTENENAEDDGCIYIGKIMLAYFNNKLCNSNMIKMLAQEKIEGLKLWYSRGDARIYKVN